MKSQGKIPAVFFFNKINKLILKLIRKLKKPRIAKTVRKKKNEIMEYTSIDIKLIINSNNQVKVILIQGLTNRIKAYYRI